MVESVGFENRCGGNPTGGSNPSLSAIFLKLRLKFKMLFRLVLSSDGECNRVRLQIGLQVFEFGYLKDCLGLELHEFRRGSVRRCIS